MFTSVLCSKQHQKDQVCIVPLIDDGFIRNLDRICGVKAFDENGNSAPLHSTVLDAKYGFAELSTDKDDDTIRYKLSQSPLYLEAYDCDNPPHVSTRVPISIRSISHEGPFFPQPAYKFTVSQQSHVGTVVGLIQAIQQLRTDEEAMTSTICNYRLSPEHVPFNIDRHGNVRLSEKLTPRRGNRPYIFQVVVEDCQRPIPRIATVDVMVQQITEGCQPGWKGLPTYIESHSNRLNKAEHLFHRNQIHLDTCTASCQEPFIHTRLQLQSALSSHEPVVTANTQACLHDPEHLQTQRQLCDIHPHTLTNLLPHTNEDVATQLNGPPLGNPPRLTAPTQAWRFERASSSVWSVDPKHVDTERPVPDNAFDTEFTLSFWLRRLSATGNADGGNQEDREEMILCSQDQKEVSWRFISVALDQCHIVVRLMAALREDASHMSQTEPRQQTVWQFGPLSDSLCSQENSNEEKAWHHYAIVFNRSPWVKTSRMVSLLVDGHNSDSPQMTQLSPSHNPYVPKEGLAKPRITLGACFDPATQLTRQHLNGELAGVMLLLGRPEPLNNIRCMAHCGESLLAPTVMKYLLSDIEVNLQSDAIAVNGSNVSHVIDILKTIAYARPRAGVSPGYVAGAAQARLLTLSTDYSCPNSEKVGIPPTEIELKVIPPSSNPDHLIEMAVPTADKKSSFWTSGGKPNPNGSPIAQAVMEHETFENSRKEHEMSSNSVAQLQIDGSNIIMVDHPVRNPGIAIFGDLQFFLQGSESDSKGSVISASAAAASVPLDSCLVWIISSGDPSGQNPQPGMHQSEGERIEWPVDQVAKLGLSGVNDKHGVKLQGRRPAGDYLRLLRRFHYWCPSFVGVNNTGTASQQQQQQPEVPYAVVFGLVCTMEAGQSTSSKFTVKLVIESSENAMEDLSSNMSMQRLASLDDVDDEVEFNKAPRRQTRDPEAIAQHALSDQEQRRAENPSLRLIGPDKRDDKPAVVIGVNSMGSGAVVAGIVLSVLAILTVGTLLLILLIRRDERKPVPTIRHEMRDRRQRRFPREPADFGGSNLKQDLTLRLTANPIGEVQYGFGTAREDLHGSCGQLECEQYIFSPPTNRSETSQRGGSNTATNLASLDEFDEDYLDQTDAEFDDPEMEPHIALVHNPPFAQEEEAGEDGLSSEGAGEGGEPEVFAADWIDSNPTEVGFQNSTKRWNLVAQTTPPLSDAPITNV